ncbi:unnamed protein product [Gemmata massiliana]|uniref:Uncharacterized protein n=1 Tax=Gemmata massiliana TaxID=1210884 RepID=A0A6P2DAV5_9BACT|nr:hypothetical protein [Gemmata massiliana]VTR98037.1 unnamed protein product [Gemmata massiliana]
MTTEADFGQSLRRRVDAALALPDELSHAVCDTLQYAVDTVCAGTSSREWADLFVTMVGRTEIGDDRPQRVLELARAVRALIDRVRSEPWPILVRELCADGIATQRTGPSIDVVRRVHRWIDLPEGRLALRAYISYEDQCRRSRVPAVEARRAFASLVAVSGDAGRPVRASALAAAIQTAGEFRVPPIELGREIGELDALPIDAAPDRYALDSGLVHQFREQGFSMTHLFALNREHALAPAGAALLRAWLPVLLTGGLTEGKLLALLLRGGYQPPGAPTGPIESAPISPKAWDNLVQIVRVLEPLTTRDGALEIVFGQFRNSAELEKRGRVVREQVLAWAARPRPGLEALRTAFQNLNVRQDGHAATLAALGLPSRMSSQEAFAFFSRYLADHSPHAEGSAESRLYREKTYDVIRRLHNVSHGFGALKIVNQRMPDGGPSAFDEFGDDLFEKLFVLNGSSYDQFPGYGVVFVGAQMERIFAHDLDHPSDPLHRYRAAWTDPQRLRSTHLDLDRFADAEFAFVRGFLGVSVPDGDFAPQYEVAGTPLTLMVWNDHFPGVEGELAMLVPTSLYRERVRPCLIRCKELDKEHPEVLDACRAGLDPNALRAECAALGLPFVDLGSPSVAGGGLVNGFPARLPPYHAWEATLPAHETRDGAGHVHKSHILGGYRTRLGNDPELDRALQPLREGNDRVFDIASSYLNLLDIFFISFATWHRGDTLDAIDFENVFDEEDQQQIAETDDDEPFNPRNTRVLTTAYAVHDQLVERRAPRSEFRVYCSANPLHLYPPPEATITLDTLDMRLVVRGANDRREISLARDRVGSGERAELLWVTHVLAYLRRTGFDMRPYDRAAVAGLISDTGG